MSIEVSNGPIVYKNIHMNWLLITAATWWDALTINNKKDKTRKIKK